MKQNELNLNVLKYIVKDVNLSVTRLGINTQLTIVEDKDYKNEPYLAIDSIPFQTMPMIFKSIKLVGEIYISENKNNEEVFYVLVRLDYKYHTFDNGTNGHQLGKIRYEVDKDIQNRIGGIDERYLRNYITKVQGLEI